MTENPNQAAPAPEGQPMQEDLRAALQQKIDSEGLRGVTPENIVDQYKGALKLASEKGRDLTEVSSKLEQFRPVMEKFEDPHFRQGFADWYQGDYLQGSQMQPQYGQQYQQPPMSQIDPAMATAMGDPMAQKVNELEKEQARNRMESEFAEIKDRYGDFVSEDVRQRVLNEVIGRGDFGHGAVKGAFHALYADQLIADSRDKAKQQVMEELKEQNSSYPNANIASVSPGAAAPQKAPAYGTPEWEEWSLKQTMDILANPRKARDYVDENF